MQTFLPSGYSFSPDKLINSRLMSQVQRMQHANVMNPFSYMSRIDILMAILILIAAIVLSIAYYGGAEDEDKQHLHRTRHKIIAGFILLIACGFVIMAIWHDHFMEPKDGYNNATFKYLPKSNLKIRMLKVEPKPKSVDDKKEYPYILYNKDNKKLGKMKQGSFTPYTSKSATMFYKYYAYINKHHLEDKFSQKVIFKKDGRYINTDGHAQWVLTNDRDLVLHLNDNSQIEQSKLVND